MPAPTAQPFHFHPDDFPLEVLLLRATAVRVHRPAATPQPVAGVVIQPLTKTHTRPVTFWASHGDLWDTAIAGVVPWTLDSTGTTIRLHLPSLDPKPYTRLPGGGIDFNANDGTPRVVHPRWRVAVPRFAGTDPTARAAVEEWTLRTAIPLFVDGTHRGFLTLGADDTLCPGFPSPHDRDTATLYSDRDYRLQEDSLRFVYAPVCFRDLDARGVVPLAAHAITNPTLAAIDDAVRVYEDLRGTELSPGKRSLLWDALREQITGAVCAY